MSNFEWMRVRSTLFLILGLSCAAFGQEYRTERFTVLEGLPSPSVSLMFEDRLGYLWAATGTGLAKFDGKTFSTYSEFDAAIEGMVRAITEDNQGNIIVSTANGLFRYNGKTFTKWHKIEFLNPENFITHFTTLGDTIFFRTSKSKLGIITNDSVFCNVPVPVKPNGIFVFNGKLLLWGEDKIVIVDGARTKIIPSGMFYSLIKIVDFGGSQLLSTDKGLYKLDETGLRKVFHEINDRVVAFSEVDSVFWLAPINPVSGLLQAKISKSKINIDQFLQEDHRVAAAKLDAENNLWVAADNKGLIKISRKNFERVMVSDNASEIVGTISRIGDQVWVGSVGDGIDVFENEKLKYSIKFKTNYQNIVRVIKPQAEAIWVGTYGGLVRIDKNTKKVKTWTRAEGLPSDSVFAIEPTQDGQLWIGTRGGGLAKFDGETFERFALPNGELKYYVWSLKLNGDKLFIATGKGLYVLMNGIISQLLSDNQKVHNVFSVGGCGPSAIFSMNFSDSLFLIIGTYEQGVGFVDTKNNHVTFIDKKKGLASNCVYYAALDQHGYAWLHTNRGIQRIKVDSHFNIVQSQLFDSKSGFEGSDANISSRLFGNDVYFGSMTGVYKFKEIKRDFRTYPLHFTGIELLYGDSQLGYAGEDLDYFGMPKNPTFTHNKNHLTFSFNRVNKFLPDEVQYQYKLDNFDEEWSVPSTVNSVTYSSLPPGSYTMLVRATGHDGKWLDDELSYPFIINPPFYQTTLFYVVVILAIVGSVVLIFYLRVSSKVRNAIALENLKAVEHDRIRTELARDFHDEIGNKLSTIINYAALLKLNGSYKNGHEIPTKLEDSAKVLLWGTKDFIWSIDPVNDDIHNLFIHIKDFGEKFFDEKSIAFRANNELTLVYRLPKGFSRQINLIFKEAMTNIYKHSKAMNVGFSLRESGGIICFLLEDDGIGFDIKSLQRLGGINNMRYRAAKIGSEINLQSNANGTKISLTIEHTKKLAYGTRIEKKDTNYRG
jgi:ligand-binding sensor domain-containing protein/signal transduction histidine kinase